MIALNQQQQSRKSMLKSILIGVSNHLLSMTCQRTTSRFAGRVTCEQILAKSTSLASKALPTMLCDYGSTAAC
jgi:hypothetical protein